MTSWDVIPAELRALNRWVVWRWGDMDPKTGKRKKPPFCATDLRRNGSSKNKTTWSTFAEAVAAVEAGKADGIGFALGPPYVGIDLDEELPEADKGAIMGTLDSYSERSPSGTGYHVVLRANLNGAGRHPPGIGVFQVDRLWYCTGEHVLGTPETIEERQAELDRVIAHFLPEEEKRHGTVATFVGPVEPVDLDDQKLLDKARSAENGPKFSALYDQGDTTGYPSHSEADAALCSHLAYWTGNDVGRIDSLFRRSELFRAKWDDRRGETTYGAQTIAKYLSREVYRPPDPTSRGLTRASESPESAGDSGGRDDDGLTDSALEESVGPESLPPVIDKGPNTDSDPESVTDSGRPFSLPISDFIALERPKAEPLLADIDGRAVVARKSLVLLGALGGHGKTTFAIDLFLHLAAGVDYPPFTVPSPASILVIENEGPEEMFADKLEARLANFPHELKAGLDVCTVDWGGFSLADDPLREVLTREIAEKKYDLVFGDPLDSIGIEGVGSPEDTRKFMVLMKETGLHKSVAWWLNTHPRKEETKEALNEISGAWGGKPDSVLLLTMLKDDRTRVRFPKLRWAKRGKRPTILLAFDPETEAFAYIGEESEEQRDYLAEIRALLGDRRWRTPKEIAAPKEPKDKETKPGIGANVDTIKKELEEHVDVFESRTGDAAKEVGRSKSATVWQLRPPAADEDESA